MNELQSFYQLASDFCKFVQEEIQSEGTLDTLISFLMRLYLPAMTLPQPKLEEESPQLKQMAPVEIAQESGRRVDIQRGADERHRSI